MDLTDCMGLNGFTGKTDVAGTNGRAEMTDTTGMEDTLTDPFWACGVVVAPQKFQPLCVVVAPQSFSPCARRGFQLCACCLGGAHA